MAIYSINVYSKSLNDETKYFDGHDLFKDLHVTKNTIDISFLNHLFTFKKKKKILFYLSRFLKEKKTRKVFLLDHKSLTITSIFQNFKAKRSYLCEKHM